MFSIWFIFALYHTSYKASFRFGFLPTTLKWCGGNGALAFNFYRVMLTFAVNVYMPSCLSYFPCSCCLGNNVWVCLVKSEAVAYSRWLSNRSSIFYSMEGYENFSQCLYWAEKDEVGNVLRGLMVQCVVLVPMIFLLLSLMLLSLVTIWLLVLMLFLRFISLCMFVCVCVNVYISM